ncbi:MAG: hypothetical protein JSV66_08835 [Trueperaceae bacterium]|nr:MAG: hypothetical protein JSV66_08835 [Trueperaceae bacterium]
MARRRPQSEPRALVNEPSYLFRQLFNTWHVDAAGPYVDELVAELADYVARAYGPLCLGLVRKAAVPRYYGLVYLLDAFGMVLRKRYRKDGESVLIFVEAKKREAAAIWREGGLARAA